MPHQQLSNRAKPIQTFPMIMAATSYHARSRRRLRGRAVKRVCKVPQESRGT